MLDKKSKIILDTLIHLGYTKPDHRFESLNTNLIPYLPQNKKYKWSYEDVQTCIVYLNKCGYVDYINRPMGQNPIPDCAYLFTTYEGTNYKKFSWLKLEEFLCKSILTPIAVSVITTLVAILLSR